LAASDARCPSVCLIRHTAPKGRVSGLGWVSAELWLRSMEGNVRSCSWMLSGRAREVDTVGAVPLEVEDEMGRQEEWEGF